MHSKALLPVLSLVFSSNLVAEISLVDSASFSTGDLAVGTFTVTVADLGGAFDADGVDKLVVTVGGEGANNGADDNTVLGVTYGGVAMTEAVAGASGNRRNSIWYLDNVSVTGDFVVTFQTNQDGIGFGAYALNGTAEGVGNTGDSGGGNTVEVETTTEGEFVVVSLGRNNFDELLGPGVSDRSQPADQWGTQAPLTELYYANLGGSSAASGYAILPEAKIHELRIYENNGSGRLIAVAFPAEAPGVDRSLEITGLVRDVVSGTVKLTWRKTRAASYILKYSTDMLNWDFDLGDGLTELQDENLDDPDTITVTFDLIGPGLLDNPKLFFRVEEE